MKKYNKTVLDKSYEEIVNEDKDLIMEILNIDKNSNIYDVVEDVVMDFITHDVDESVFKDDDQSLLDISVNLRTKGKRTVDIYYALETILKLDIKPYVLFVEDRWEYCMHFGVKKEFKINRWSEYLKLIVECLEYIDSKDIDAIICSVSLDGDYHKEISSNVKEMHNIGFNDELFGAEGTELIF